MTESESRPPVTEIKKPEEKIAELQRGDDTPHFDKQNADQLERARRRLAKSRANEPIVQGQEEPTTLGEMIRAQRPQTQEVGSQSAADVLKAKRDQREEALKRVLERRAIRAAERPQRRKQG